MLSTSMQQLRNRCLQKAQAPLLLPLWIYGQGSTPRRILVTEFIPTPLEIRRWQLSGILLSWLPSLALLHQRLQQLLSQYLPQLQPGRRRGVAPTQPQRREVQQSVPGDSVVELAGPAGLLALVDILARLATHITHSVCLIKLKMSSR